MSKKILRNLRIYLERGVIITVLLWFALLIISLIIWIVKISLPHMREALDFILLLIVGVIYFIVIGYLCRNIKWLKKL